MNASPAPILAFSRWAALAVLSLLSLAIIAAFALNTFFLIATAGPGLTIKTLLYSGAYLLFRLYLPLLFFPLACLYILTKRRISLYWLASVFCLCGAATSYYILPLILPMPHLAMASWAVPFVATVLPKLASGRQ